MGRAMMILYSSTPFFHFIAQNDNMGHSPDHQLLTHEQAGAILQRHMSGKDAWEWLRADRKYDPLIPFVDVNGQIFYAEVNLVTFLHHITSQPLMRSHPDRRQSGGMHARRGGAERRSPFDKRRAAPKIMRNHIDRRFMPRPDRRSDIDRRLLGEIDRRSINDRRGREMRPEAHRAVI